MKITVLRKSKTLTIVTFLLLSLCFQACMRFTPSRASLVSKEGSRARLTSTDTTTENATDDAVEKDKKRYLGKDAFYSLENKHKERLKNLTKERSDSIKPSGSATYRIGIGDILELFVFETEELNRKVRVRPDGNISLPLLGQIKAIGLTEDELQQEITKKLNTYMHSPQVQLFIDQYAAHKVWVVGEVSKPGAYPLSRDNYSLIELISEAGGRTERASGTIILIPERASALSKDNTIDDDSTSNESVSPSEMIESSELANAKATTSEPFIESLDPQELTGVRNGIEIAFDDLVGSVDDSPLTVPLRAGDTIVVPEAGKIQIEGEVKTPGSFPLSSRTTLSGAIAGAGGFSYPANAEIVEVIRELGSGEKAMIVLNVDKINAQEEKDVRLRDGDLIRVPSARGRFVVNQITTIISSLLGRLFAPITTGP